MRKITKAMTLLTDLALRVLLVLFGMAVLASANSKTASAVSVCDLLSHPSQFANRRVRVKAVYRYSFEVQQLDSITCCPSQHQRIWVEFGDLNGRSRRLYKRLPTGTGIALVKLGGTFKVGGPFADGYRLDLRVERIEGVDASYRSWSPRPASAPECWVRHDR
jgi:hypothetical protein